MRIYNPKNELGEPILTGSHAANSYAELNRVLDANGKVTLTLLDFGIVGNDRSINDVTLINAKVTCDGEVVNIKPNVKYEDNKMVLQFCESDEVQHFGEIILTFELGQKVLISQA